MVEHGGIEGIGGGEEGREGCVHLEIKNLLLDKINSDWEIEKKLMGQYKKIRN